MAKEKAKPEAAAEAPAVSFEEQLEALEAIAKQLDTPGLPLEKAIALYEKGVSLAQGCRGYLEAAESRIEVLMKRAGSDPMEEATVEPFDPFNEKEQ